mgnify:CR=1 FL=1
METRLKLTYVLTRDLPTTEVLKTVKWDSFFHDCTPPSMGHILTKKSSSIHHLRTTNTVTVPRFNTYFMKKSIAFRASIVCNPLTSDLARTSMQRSRTIQEWPLNPTNYAT